jgi:hypothetical protein
VRARPLDERLTLVFVEQWRLSGRSRDDHTAQTRVQMSPDVVLESRAIQLTTFRELRGQRREDAMQQSCHC